MDKVIHYCWFGGAPLTETAKRSIESWKKYAPDFEIVRWDETNFDVSSCSWCRDAYKAGKWAFVSDYARFKILYDYGGVYMDVGSELIRHLGPLMDKIPLAAIEELSLTASSGLIVAAPARDGVVGDMVRLYEEIEFKDDDDFLSENTVNEMLTKRLERDGFERADRNQRVGEWTLLNSSYFNPVYGFGGFHIKPETYSVHRSSGSWVEPKFAVKRKVVQRLSPFIGRRPAQVIGRVAAEVRDAGLCKGVRNIVALVLEKTRN